LPEQAAKEVKQVGREPLRVYPETPPQTLAGKEKRPRKALFGGTFDKAYLLDISLCG
jgi:hypothetical protein